MQKLLFRYLIFVGIPYLIAKRIEKLFWKHASPELKKEVKKKLKDAPELDKVSEHTKDSLDSRGGANPVVLWVAKTVLKDFAIKVAVAGGVGASIWSGSADNAASQLAKYGSAMLTAPGKGFRHLYRRIKGIDPQHSRDIKEILFDKELGNEDKLALLKIKIESAVKNLTGSKRKQFIMFVIATILFSVGRNFSLFAWFMCCNFVSQAAAKWLFRLHLLLKFFIAGLMCSRVQFGAEKPQLFWYCLGYSIGSAFN